ncbi:MAG: hypothetical protein AUK47_18520 [Deltaproteobacteria bacterium CG2_30_63_29]|nr:MAG: hypothetical protein AUK47_18520 [Deltaproteobacteria bacterium CG2_30_63_29]PIW01763.1 MAG: hypothetical protein COW42_03925 [Deltaproteobacteria bacterium CG17_big_fil_post_rev_8_21_14_2_50_63_7]PJB43173.1 MAG: hypothetical protein CO108_10460 [Deltaproteobacteria bacterium CG_4_9_14_3_um_filter_63_12]
MLPCMLLKSDRLPRQLRTPDSGLQTLIRQFDESDGPVQAFILDSLESRVWSFSRILPCRLLKSDRLPRQLRTRAYQLSP